MSPCPGPPWPASREAPGRLGRIGPITAIQARHLAEAAEIDPAVPVADHRHQPDRAGHRGHPDPPPHPRQPGGWAVLPRRSVPRPAAGNGLVSRVTLTISQDTLTAARQAGRRDHPPAGRSASQTPAGETRPSPGLPLARPRHPEDHRGRARGPRPAPWSGRWPRPRLTRRPEGARTPVSHRPTGRRRGCGSYVIARDVDLPLPGLPPARLARRPGPHPPLRPWRPDLRLQPRRRLPQPSPAQATPRWTLHRPAGPVHPGPHPAGPPTATAEPTQSGGREENSGAGRPADSLARTRAAPLLGRQGPHHRWRHRGSATGDGGLCGRSGNPCHRGSSAVSPGRPVPGLASPPAPVPASPPAQPRARLGRAALPLVLQLPRWCLQP